MKELMAWRIPNSVNLLTFNQEIPPPAECQSSAFQALKSIESGFLQEDINDFSRLANQYCSHLSGWIEYNPGHCSAGGPPPICVANHWYKSSDSMERWKNEQNQIRDRRMKQLLAEVENIKKRICECWVANVEKQYDYFLGQTDITNTSAQNTGIPCVGGTCATPYQCINGFCVLAGSDNIYVNPGLPTSPAIQDALAELGMVEYGKGISEQLENSALASIDDKISASVLDKYIRDMPKVLEMVGKVNKALNSTPIYFLSELVTPRAVSLHYSGYKYQLNQVADALGHINSGLGELKRFEDSKIDISRPCYCRNPKEVIIEIRVWQSNLDESLKTLSDFALGVRIEREFGDNYCYEALLTEVRKIQEIVRRLPRF